MPIQLTITYDPNSDACQVTGIPLAKDTATGQMAPLRGICYGALEAAKDAIRQWRPDEQPGIVLANGASPLANRLNGKPPD